MNTQLSCAFPLLIIYMYILLLVLCATTIYIVCLQYNFPLYLFVCTYQWVVVFSNVFMGSGRCPDETLDQLTLSQWVQNYRKFLMIIFSVKVVIVFITQSTGEPKIVADPSNSPPCVTPSLFTCLPVQGSYISSVESRWPPLNPVKAVFDVL